MTYKKQMEKVIKEYMASIGFKYYAPQYIYVKKIDDEKVLSMGYAAYSGYQKEYYELSIHACIIYRSWNNLLYQLTEGSCDFDSFMNGPVFFPTRVSYNEPHVEFKGFRKMEENLAAYTKELETRAFPILERYMDKGLLYEDMKNNDNNMSYCKNIKWYMPIAHYVYGNDEAALRYVENVLKESEQNYRMNPQAPAYIKNLHDFTLYYQNLKKLIEGQSLPPRDIPSVLT